MNPPEIEAALESLAADGHAWRLRQLVDDDNPDVEQRDGYRGLVLRRAAGTPDPPPDPAVDYGASSPASAVPCCGGGP